MNLSSLPPIEKPLERLACYQRARQKERARRSYNIPHGASREAFGEELKRRRLLAGLTRTGLANNCACSPRQIAYYEDLEQVPKPAMQATLAFALSTTIEDLWRLPREKRPVGSPLDEQLAQERRRRETAEEEVGRLRGEIGALRGQRPGAVVRTQPEISEAVASVLTRDKDKSGKEHFGTALSRKERAVIELVAKGYSNREIARDRNVAVGTVKSQLEKAMAKLGARNRAHSAAIWAVRSVLRNQ